MPDSAVDPLVANRSRRRSVARSVGPLRPGPAGFPLVAIGASAGGLEACAKLLDALPAASGMAFILVQHLDPTHESLLVELLGGHTSMAVRQAADGMAIEPDHLYVIAPASYLTLGDGVLRVRPTQAGRGARLPFDVLLQSMAPECGGRVVCVVLSGTGADGSVGLRAIKRHGGFVIAQEPGEAGYDGMPRSAMATGDVDAVLRLADMPDAIVRRSVPVALHRTSDSVETTDRLPEIVALLRARTAHDFTLYKPGTLRRRVERRMAMAAFGADEMAGYVATLERDASEVEQLAKDLLIHVTGFFRDPAVFDTLASTVVPGLIAGRQADQPLRVWVAGCSTGEEAYSLAIVLQERIAAAGDNIRFQIFASDADADAVAFARDGLYPATIEADVSPTRLARFFTKEDQGFRVKPELRATIVFTVQDLLADPPFSRLDLVACRNVLIYLGPEAQRKVVALFHFALRRGGVLLLGNSEGVGDASDRFEVVSKPARLFRHVGRSRPGDVGFAATANESVRLPATAARSLPPSRQAAFADLTRRLALDRFAPATILSNRKHELLYSLGPTERYLRVAPGHPTLDVLAMVGGDVRTRLRSAMLRAVQDDGPVCVSGGHTTQGGKTTAFSIEVRPIQGDNENLLLIHFVDQPDREGQPAPTAIDGPRIAELERELKTAQAELHGAVRSLEISGDEQRAINENALSVNEEFQSTNEELLTSKEELQSLNEELTALNSQLQETLEQQRTTSNDLQNVLYSTDVATLFLDSDLKIRFFTPATKALFAVIQTDIGRPLQDLRSLAADGALSADARIVLETLQPREREIETPVGVWCRRILPYRTHDNAVGGVVITFTDITQRRHAAEALEAAKRDADLANAAKSRFLAAASHDLRQPLQTLALLQKLLANRVEGTASERLVARIDDTVRAMSGMLNTLLDINQIEAGVVRAEVTEFDVGDMLISLRDAFADHAQAQRIGWRVVPCASRVRSDPRLLEQMLRNLVSNALKFTKTGKVLLGCRHLADTLRIEVWDTGVGIPEAELPSIFDEYHQVDNAAHERNRGLGLGLSIVQRLAVLLGHRVRVRSREGKGSVFSVEVPFAVDRPASMPARVPPHVPRVEPGDVGAATRQVGNVLVVEDDDGLRELLALILSDDGHHALAVPDGAAAVQSLPSFRPDLILTDYNLPDAMDGLTVIAKLREALGPDVAAIVLTGDVSTGALTAIAAQHCRYLSKPVDAVELGLAVQELLLSSASVISRSSRVGDANSRVVFVVDDDRNIRDAVRALLEDDGRTVLDFPSGEAFFKVYRPGSDGCLLVDAYLPGIGGLQLLQRLRAAGDPLPTIVITGSSDVPMAVQAMKSGAADFIEKPITATDLLASIARALECSQDTSKQIAWHHSAAAHIAHLTPRQRQIMDLVLAGYPSKNIAADLGISQRTVENHRASIMRVTGVRSLPALARLALAAAVAAPDNDVTSIGSRAEPSFVAVAE